MDEASKGIPNPYITPNVNSPAAVATSVTTGTSQDTRTIVTVLLLIFVFPVGFFMMWFWSHWKVWVKILLTVPLVLLSLLVIPAVLLVAINPTAQFEKAKQLEIKNNCTTQCLDSEDASCVTNCVEANSIEGGSGNTSYEEAFKASYIKSCLATGSDKKAYCECTLNYLEDTVVDLQDTKEVMSSLPKAIESCKDKI